MSHTLLSSTDTASGLWTTPTHVPFTRPRTIACPPAAGPSRSCAGRSGTPRRAARCPPPERFRIGIALPVREPEAPARPAGPHRDGVRARITLFGEEHHQRALGAAQNRQQASGGAGQPGAELVSQDSKRLSAIRRRRTATASSPVTAVRSPAKVQVSVTRRSSRRVAREGVRPVTGGSGPASRPGRLRSWRVRGVVGVWSTRFNAGELGAAHARVRARRAQLQASTAPTGVAPHTSADGLTSRSDTS